MAGRLTVLPEERLQELRPLLQARLRGAAEILSGDAFSEFFDHSMRALLVDGFHRASADEGTIWLLDETRESLVPRYNSGPKAAIFVGSFRQSLHSGMISVVVATEQPICENEVRRNQRQDRSLDEQLHMETCAMIAVPFYFANELRGVISCVKLLPADTDLPEPPGFTFDDLRRIQLTVGLLSRLVEYRLLVMCLGLEGMG